MRSLGSLIALASFVSLSGCPDPDEPPPGWQPVEELQIDGWLLDVWGPSPDDLYAVGGTPDAGVVMHFDGTGWTPVPLGVDVPLLNWVHGFGPNDITFVGNGGTVLHFDGSTFELQTTPTVEDLWGVWGSSPNDLWSVGGRGREEGQATILRYDGTTWSQVATPTLMRPRVYAFFKVWGSSADDVVIVGQRGGLLRWNGTELIEELVGTSEDLISVWGTGPDRIAVVGGRSNGTITAWDGTEWRTQALAPLPGLNGVWMRDPSTVHVVGIEGTTATVDFDTLDYQEDYQDTRQSLHAVFGDSSGMLTTVGGNLASVSGPYEGLAFRRPLGPGE